MDDTSDSGRGTKSLTKHELLELGWFWAKSQPQLLALSFSRDSAFFCSAKRTTHALLVKGQDSQEPAQPGRRKVLGQVLLNFVLSENTVLF